MMDLVIAKYLLDRRKMPYNSNFTPVGQCQLAVPG